MWDGGAVPIDENLLIAQELLRPSAAAKIILEIEIGVVGGEEDGVEAAIDDKLFTTPRTSGEKTVDALGVGEKGSLPLLAATFGNVQWRVQARQRQTASRRAQHRARRLPPRSSVSPSWFLPFDFVSTADRARSRARSRNPSATASSR